jgi:hypothetical protein
MTTLPIRATPPRLAVVMFLTALAPSALGAQELPLGDGHVTDHPAAGNVYACRTTFRGGGARHDGPWFHGDTWDPTAKPHVSGHALWPDASYSLTNPLPSCRRPACTATAHWPTLLGGRGRLAAFR